ncbi:hypothetical protein RF11_10695 [Thelohanellus kitauei]|uniref:Uncharacterized protein n=1 Tax=Thelohanellus kitauei TaxID=669202 RepID=A0A0C2MTZ1_THEKT|nr:hypothetical protein RF11_10695 [Thelohanellus kitauei]
MEVFGRSQSLSDNIKLSTTPLEPYEIQELLPQDGDLGFISCNKKLFLELQTLMKNSIDTIKEFYIMKKKQLKQKPWQISASYMPELTPKADELYQIWFIKSNTNDTASDQCVLEKKPDEELQTINIDILSDEGF